ncbi:MAG: hypoxanthine phosphoribosyltransferase [Syntrophobacteraceae bacterium CG2_30_61_12]|nr:MAG: hypoxanthine phosphoribosyltransferase [Syntrophobacteraceae bacterium CG2_30_61_12]PIU31776.1 MAG: hypoxanthine phosphoribosyltransferase [Syntrophobacteraceae bacterium CG07_land_8_20_14_0_80_61_8]
MQEHRLIPRVPAEDLQQRIRELAAQIQADYEGRELILIGVLKGAFVFLADLARHLDLPLEIDFLRLASYGSRTESSGAIELTKDIEISITDRDVLVVEDIVDSGITMAWLLRYLKSRQPRSLRVCALIDKFQRRQADVRVDYAGIRIDQGFLVGYGLDYSEKYRNLETIYEVKFTAPPNQTEAPVGACDCHPPGK